MVRGGKPFNGKFMRYDPGRGLIHFLPGYSWDGASIPKLAQVLIWKDWLTREESLPHDGGYQLGRNGVFAEVPNARKRIDKMFFRGMRHTFKWWQWGYSKAGIMYRAVRVGGRKAFGG